jgi:hypothetical protein
VGDVSGRARAGLELREAGISTVQRRCCLGPVTPSQVAAPSDADGVTRIRLTEAWGIAPVPWLCTVRVRILVVTDGRINGSHDSEEFGLGQVLDTLHDPSSAWWVTFEAELVKRDPPESFRFTQDGFHIDDYHEIWFFGDWPGEVANDPAFPDSQIDLPQYAPLDDAELKIVAEWMDRGGGVFAAGDHTLLGASMCRRIPRVRTMRRWTRAQGVPSFNDAHRHETLQHTYDETTWWEGDEWAQRIYPVLRRDGRRPFDLFGAYPHPLLCGPNGVIDHFPDHMHEGSVFENDEVRLDESLGIPDYGGEEYPILEPEILAATVGEQPETFRLRPRPEVVAHALTTNPEPLTAPEPGGVFMARTLDVFPGKRFAIVGAYDGDAVGVGRVIVDSTWHHWFSMNLVGFQAKAPALYQGVQSYYRNVALWLARPEQRAWMLFAATWGLAVGKYPGAFDKVMGIWENGARALDAIGRTASRCIVSELVATVLGPTIAAMGDDGAPENLATSPTLGTLVDQAVVGGIMYGQLDDARRHIIERAHGRTTAVDPDVVRKSGLAGVSHAVREVASTLAHEARELTGLSERFGRYRERATRPPDPPLESLDVPDRTAS